MNEGKAFDATESYLRDSSQGIRSKLTVSLVYALRGILRRGPQFENVSPESRREAFHAAAGELTRRGIDASSLVRYGMFREVVTPLLTGLLHGWFFQPSIAASTPHREIPGVSLPPKGLDVDRWRQVLGLREEIENWPPTSVEDLLKLFTNILVPIAPLIESWVLTAPLDDLLLLTPPANVDVLESYSDASVGELREQYEWVVDHLSETFYQDWRTSSLHHAYSWLAHREPPSCPPELMRDRKIDISKLNAEIARRATSERPEEPRALSTEALLTLEMVDFAIPLLREGRFREAAAVFEFGIRQMPYSGELRNNFGFCLIPDDAREALVHLESAMRLNFSYCEVNTYNQMCCLIALQNDRAALNLADRFWSAIRSRPALPATLWRRDDARWTLFHAEDPRQKVAELAVTTARAEGWKEDIQLWLTRFDEFEGSD
jgi:hypothetical protein